MTAILSPFPVKPRVRFLTRLYLLHAFTKCITSTSFVFFFFGVIEKETHICSKKWNKKAHTNMQQTAEPQYVS